MMLGLGHEPKHSLAVLDHMDDRNALEMFRKVKERAQYLVATLPSQYEYLTHVRQRSSRMNEPVAPFLYDDAGQLWKELVALNQPSH
jgi:hypothetical protein